MKITTKPRVAIIEDEPDLRDNIVRFFDARGYPCWGVESAEDFYRELAVHAIDIVVLDLGLPGEDGMKVAEHLATSQQYGIIIVSARSTLQDRLAGLGAGADAYLVKPCDLREIAASVDAAWRRLKNQDSAASDFTKSLPRWQLSHIRWTLFTPDGTALPLTPSEYRFIRCLAESSGEPVSRDYLAISLGYTPENYDYHRIESLVSRLRKKAQLVVGSELPIKAVQSYGFVFSDNCEII